MGFQSPAGDDNMNFDNTFVRIDLDAISDNLDIVQNKTAVKVMAVVIAQPAIFAVEV